MMRTMTHDMEHVSGDAAMDDAAAFLADYASLLSGCGAISIRTEKNTCRIARAFGLEADIFIMPSHVAVTVWREGRKGSSTAVRKIPHSPISFDLNARLSRLSWEVADNGLDLSEASRRFAEIQLTGPTGKAETLLLASLANASFCRLFGGDAAAMAIVFLSTLAGYRLKQIMLGDRRDVRVTFFCASFFSTALSSAGIVFGIGSTPEIALGTGVLYLIPGVPYINSVSDLIYGHYLCAFSRFLDAAVLTACLSAGLCAGMFLLGLKFF